MLDVHRVPARPVVLATLACPAGCRGDADLQLGDYQDVRFHLHRRGRITLRFRLGAKTRRLLRRYRSVPYGLLLTWVQPSLGTDTPTRPDLQTGERGAHRRARGRQGMTAQPLNWAPPRMWWNW